jgi:secreted protein with Ig-like and vWFA domain
VPVATAKPRAAPGRTATREQQPLLVPLDDPTTNYAVRVRRTLDELLSRRLGQLRVDGVRSSKVELTELLLWELAEVTPEALEERLSRFRRAAPR